VATPPTGTTPPDEPTGNDDKKGVHQRLADALGLPPEDVPVVLKELEALGWTRRLPVVRGTTTPETGDVDEDEDPESINKPVIVRGNELNVKLTKEQFAGRLALGLLGLFALVQIVTVIAQFQLGDVETAAALNELSDKLLLLVVGVFAYYFGTKQAGE
jgi:hypothetical protein